MIDSNEFRFLAVTVYDWHEFVFPASSHDTAAKHIVFAQASYAEGRRRDAYRFDVEQTPPPRDGLHCSATFEDIRLRR